MKVIGDWHVHFFLVCVINNASLEIVGRRGLTVHIGF